MIKNYLKTAFRNLLRYKGFALINIASLTIGMIGCFVIGFVLALSEKISLSMDWKLFLATGLCGGFTTFSAFTNETFVLLRAGQVWNAITYITVSVILGIIATAIGYFITRLVA